MTPAASPTRISSSPKRSKSWCSGSRAKAAARSPARRPVSATSSTIEPRNQIMTLLLASVTGTAEAEDAVARGVDIIDVQGAAPPERVRAVLAAVAGRRGVSAGAGEAAQAEALADAGAEYVRVLSRHSEDIVTAAPALTRR